MKKITDAEIGEKIKKERIKLGWSRLKLSKISGISYPSIVAYEQLNHKKKPSILAKLAIAMDLMPSTFYKPSGPSNMELSWMLTQAGFTKTDEGFVKANILIKVEESTTVYIKVPSEDKTIVLPSEPFLI